MGTPRITSRDNITADNQDIPQEAQPDMQIFRKKITESKKLNESEHWN